MIANKKYSPTNLHFLKLRLKEWKEKEDTFLSATFNVQNQQVRYGPKYANSK